MENRMEQLREECLQCQKCPLAATRHHVVFGTGKTGAEVVFVGEGPGENEDLQGEPFVGRGGALLDKYLEAVDLSRERNIYIAKHRQVRPAGRTATQSRRRPPAVSATSAVSWKSSNRKSSFAWAEWQPPF